MHPGTQEDLPLVTIAIPTYNRVALVLRAVQSALAQDYPSVEVLVADNGSTDDTETALREYCERAPNLRYLRRARNHGIVDNFLFALDRAAGTYFMWLADDDWLDPSYVRSCIDVLLADPDVALAGGTAIYYHGADESWREPFGEIRDRSIARRVLRCFRHVRMNGEFYGIAPTALRRSVGLPDTLGGDWVHVAALAASGSLRAAPTCIHRDAGGASDAMRPGLRRFAVPIARRAITDLAALPSVRSAPRPQRLAISAGTAAVIIWRFGVRAQLEPYFVGQRLKGILPEDRYVQLRSLYRRITRQHPV